MKCPNCGSTAQVGLLWESTDKYNNEITREYDCGCGCCFTVTYEVKNIKITSANGEENP